MKFESGSYYHIYNRGVDSSPTFLTTRDYSFFLEKFNFYLSLSTETLAYCILRNHFHFLIKVLNKNEMDDKIRFISDSEYEFYYTLPSPKNKHFPIHTLIGHWMNSYSKYFNKKYNRSGPLWDGRLNKRLIDSETYLQKSICYVHRNPIHHGIVNNYHDYSFSSYSEILNINSDIVSPESTLEVFGGKENFIAAHQDFKGTYDPDI